MKKVLLILMALTLLLSSNQAIKALHLMKNQIVKTALLYLPKRVLNH